MMANTDWRDAARTLPVAVLGAALFWLIGFPAALLTGPAAAVSIASLSGLRMAVPALLRDICFLVLGVSIGSTVTPEVLATARAWPLSLVVLSASLITTLIVLRLVLRHGFGFGATTAMLASTPGHLSFVLSLTSDLKADASKVALVQSVRVLLLTLLVPLIITIWGAQGTATLADDTPLSWGILALLLILALALGLVFKRLHVPAAFLIGGIVVSAIGHGSDLTPGVMPFGSTQIAFVTMGAIIGTRFNGTRLSELLQTLTAGVVATLIACALAAVGALLASLIIDLPTEAILLAFAPGGVEVMAALAVETGLEPAFVAAHHVFRIILLTILMPTMLISARRKLDG